MLTPTSAPEIPFYLELPAPGGSSITIRGPEGDDVVTATWDGAHLAAELPLFNTELSGTLTTGALVGHFELDSSLGESSIPWRAVAVAAPDPTALFPQPAGAAAIALGPAPRVFKLHFSESGDGKLVLEQPSPGVVVAHVHFNSGNISDLVGNGSGDAIELADFEGSAPTLLTLTLSADREQVTGSWLAGASLEWKETLNGQASPDFDLPLAIHLASPRALDLPALAGASYAGKPMIVELAGSWCTTCKLAAPVLVELYGRFHPEGLEILTLAYEFSDDPVYNKRQAERFKADYHIPWQVIPVDGGANDFAKIMPPQLADIDTSGFPIAMFLDRKHRVRSFQAGFPSPAVKVEFAHAVAAYERQIVALLAP